MLTIHVGKSRKIPFTVTLNGVLDETAVVEVGASQPGNIKVELTGPREIKVTALGLTSSADAVVKAYVGTPSEAHFPLEFEVVAAPPPVAQVTFGEAGPEEPA